ncbi:ATP-binding protein [Streptomyces sp. NBC_00868]|uniref:ATP-binding protein n=1 Tax=Streptomyces sp. NBC_00868 TaxID=2903683 RepID=UPI00386F6F62|nr:ATP-binding protein [Streptomyces sp. NBC_00868]
MMEQPATPSAATQLSRPTHHFCMRFSSTPRGARLARRLAAVRLDAWGYPYDTTAHTDVTLLVAELCTNAIQHGHVPGRDFRLNLKTLTPTTLRIEVTDTRSERLPVETHDAPLAEHGRGLNIVAALATRWDWTYRPEGGPGKIVWAEYEASATSQSPAP